MQTSMQTSRASVGSSAAAPKRCSCHALPHAKPFLTGESHYVFVPRHARRSWPGQHGMLLSCRSTRCSLCLWLQPAFCRTTHITAFWHAAGRHRLRSTSQPNSRTERGHQVAVHAALVPRFTRVVKGYTFFYGDAAGECCPCYSPHLVYLHSSLASFPLSGSLQLPTASQVTSQGLLPRSLQR